MLKRFEDLWGRAWCEWWRWQYIFVTRCFPHVRDEIWQSGYDDGFQSGEEHAQMARGYDAERERKLASQIADLSRDSENCLSGVAGNA